MFDFSTLSGKINLAMVIFFLCTVAFSAWRGWRMRTARACWRLATVVCAAGLAFVTVSILLSNAGAVFSQESLMQAFETADPEIHQFLTDAFSLFPNAVALALALPISVLAPILFILIYIVYSIPLYIIYLIIAIIVFPKRKESKLHLTRLWGLIAGTVKGMVVSFVYIFPLLGLGLIVNNAFAHIDTSADPDLQVIADTAAEATDAVCDFPGIKLLYNAFGDSFFSALTSFSCEIDGVTYKCDISQEADTFGKIIVNAKPILDADFNNLGQKESDALKAVAADINNSTILRVILSEALSSMCEQWSQGNAPLDIQKPSVDDAHMQQILDGAIETFRNSTPNSIGQDLIALADAIDVLISHNVFNAFKNPDSLADLFANDEFILDLKDAMQGSESIQAVVHETVKIGVQSICSSFIQKETYIEACEDIAAEVASTLNTLSTAQDKETQAQILSNTIQDTFGEHMENLSVSDAMLNFASEIIVDEFANQITNGSVSTDDVLAYLGIGAAKQ